MNGMSVSVVLPGANKALWVAVFPGTIVGIQLCNNGMIQLHSATINLGYKFKNG